MNQNNLSPGEGKLNKAVSSMTVGQNSEGSGNTPTNSSAEKVSGGKPIAKPEDKET